LQRKYLNRSSMGWFSVVLKVAFLLRGDARMRPQELKTWTLPGDSVGKLDSVILG
jgi:hypothetical protein